MLQPIGGLMRKQVINFIGLVLLTGIITPEGFAQNMDTAITYRKVKVLPVPSFGYSPETGSYIGAVALFTLDFYHDTNTRISNAKVEFNYTWRRQIIFEGEWNYFFKQEKWYTQGLLQYMRYPDLYYGIGETTPQNDEVLFESNRIVADFNILRKVADKTFIGPKFRYLDYRAVQYDTSNVVYPELKDAGIGGIGVTLLKDTRNNLLNSSAGTYLEMTPTYNYAGNYSYIKLWADARGYKSIGPKLILSGRFLNEITIGNAPFFDCSLIGGDNKIRGFYYGRYREQNLSTIQGEARMIVWWRIGFAAFGGLTKLYPGFDALSFNNIKTNYGGGIRFVIDRKQNINLRLDYAIASGGQDGFYISFGESF